MSNRPHFLLGCGIALATVIVGAACGGIGSGEVKDPGVSGSPNNGASDVKITTCAKTDFGVSMTLEVKNSTKSLASYIISAEAVEAGTGRRVGEATAAVNSLRPGQTTATTAVGGLEDKVDKIDCKIVEVTRT